MNADYQTQSVSTANLQFQGVLSIVIAIPILRENSPLRFRGC
jgi:hypothetical protein